MHSCQIMGEHNGNSVRSICLKIPFSPLKETVSKYSCCWHTNVHQNHLGILLKQTDEVGLGWDPYSAFLAWYGRYFFTDKLWGTKFQMTRFQRTKAGVLKLCWTLESPGELTGLCPGHTSYQLNHVEDWHQSAVVKDPQVILICPKLWEMLG